MKKATVNMMDQVGKNLALPKGAKVLDAGCGEGATAKYLSKEFGYQVIGVDLLDFNIKRAKERNVLDPQNPRFNVGNYSKLDIPDNSLDGIYTLETLVHSPEYREALKEFSRVLKKGGKLVLFEYSLPKELSKHDSEIFEIISEGSAMHSFPLFMIHFLKK